MPDIQITAADTNTTEGGGTFSAYLAVPKATPAPGIVLAQEIFGVNKVMRTIADTFSQQGFVAICPDLFWRQEPGIQITDGSEAEWQKAFQLFQGFDIDKGVDDLKATLAVLRKRPECDRKVAAIGYCLGGSLAYLMATRSDVDCAVGYYGVSIHASLDEAKNIKKPLMLHIAENDKFVNKEAQEQIKAALGNKPLVTIHTYPGQDHAFARVGGQSYVPQAAALANQRTQAFLDKNLGRPARTRPHQG
jgi:carboxymethylenebutenolidase